MTDTLAAVVVGAGSAGLATSYELAARGLPHVVIERGRIGETWRTQRWDSFRLNTPGWANALPGLPFPGDPDGFDTAAALVGYFEDYRRRFALPVREGITVRAVVPFAGRFRIETDGGDYEAPSVVVASGNLNRPSLPSAAARLHRSIVQLHASAYTRPDALPAGRVLVVGGAQTGCQIAEDLIEAGRQVLLAAGRAPRVPRRYRGRDIFEWLRRSGFFAQHASALTDPAMLTIPQPQVSGVNGGKTVSYQDLARRGVRLLGRLQDVQGTWATFEGDLRAHLRFADEMSARLRDMVDAFIDREAIDAPAPDVDPLDAPAEYDAFPELPETIDLEAEGVTSVIWCTGFRGEFGWLPAEALQDGRPNTRTASPASPACTSSVSTGSSAATPASSSASPRMPPALPAPWRLAPSPDPRPRSDPTPGAA
ncbi:MAG: flavin-containing monooxygenase [Dehalococcoidia bacterium]